MASGALHGNTVNLVDSPKAAQVSESHATSVRQVGLDDITLDRAAQVVATSGGEVGGAEERSGREVKGKAVHVCVCVCVCVCVWEGEQLKHSTLGWRAARCVDGYHRIRNDGPSAKQCGQIKLLGGGGGGGGGAVFGVKVAEHIDYSGMAVHIP